MFYLSVFAVEKFVWYDCLAVLPLQYISYAATNRVLSSEDAWFFLYDISKCNKYKWIRYSCMFYLSLLFVIVYVAVVRYTHVT